MYCHQTGQLYNHRLHHLSHFLVLCWREAKMIFTISSKHQNENTQKTGTFLLRPGGSEQLTFDSEYIRLMPTKSYGLIYFLSIE